MGFPTLGWSSSSSIESRTGAPCGSSQKWLNAGVLEDGKHLRVEEGTPQGGSASPLLANIYLHDVFDLWVQAWRQKRAHGDVIVVRYADGTPVQSSTLWGASPLIPIVRSGI